MTKSSCGLAISSMDVSSINTVIGVWGNNLFHRSAT